MYFIFMLLFYIFIHLLNKINILNISKYQDRKHSSNEIEGLRGFLGMGVFFHHSLIHFNFLQNNRWEIPESIFYTLQGQYSVGFFFIITAYLFTSKVINLKPIDWNKIYLSRIKRIIPMYLVATTVLIVIAVFQARDLEKVLTLGVLKNILKLFSFGFLNPVDIAGYKEIHTINAGVYWTLYWEWVFYFCLPLLAFLINFKLKLFLVFSIILIVLSGNYFLYYFIAGIIVAVFNNKLKLNKLLADIIFLVGIITCFVFFKTAYGLIQACLGYMVFYTLINSFYIKKILTNQCFQWLGKISYSVYLIHGLVITVSVIVMKAIGFSWNNDNYWGVVLIMGFFVIILSSVSYIVVERKFNVY
jgi:peptidoglycan/LPS O-acetylase OafA/YrhL